MDYQARKTLAREPNANEIRARTEHEHGVCAYGNHALCIHQRDQEHARAAAGLPPPYPRGRELGQCPPVLESQIDRCVAFLERGEWVDGRGSYGLKHAVEEADPEGRYVSNGALCVAAIRLGLGVAWTFPDLHQPSPNARVFKLGRVPQAKRGAKAKCTSNR